MRISDWSSTCALPICLILMAVLWSVATLLCAIAQTYEQMLGARFLVGVGEAAYGSVGIAVVLSVFAPRVHAALAGAFMAGGSFGSVIGVASGGFIAVQFDRKSTRLNPVTNAHLGCRLLLDKNNHLNSNTTYAHILS